MSTNQEFQETEITSASTRLPAVTRKSAADKKLKAPDREYGKLKLPLLVDHEHALRIASVLLERAGEEIYTHEQLHDLAMDRFMEYLKVKKGLDFQEIFTKKLQPSK
jgi:hypothetical protein